jgi:hypothetical protein
MDTDHTIDQVRMNRTREEGIPPGADSHVFSYSIEPGLLHISVARDRDLKGPVLKGTDGRDMRRTIAPQDKGAETIPASDGKVFK